MIPRNHRVKVALSALIRYHCTRANYALKPWQSLLDAAAFALHGNQWRQHDARRHPDPRPRRVRHHRHHQRPPVMLEPATEERWWTINDNFIRYALNQVQEGVTPEQAYAILCEHSAFEEEDSE